jgi:hypothetical protein
MALRHTIGDVEAISEGIWRTRLTPADVRRIGEGRSSFGARSVVGVWRADFDAGAGLLSVDPDATTVLNIGASDDVFFLDLGDGDGTRAQSSRPAEASSRDPGSSTSAGRADKAFLQECERHLDPQLVSMAQRLLSEVRARYRGDLQEGKARKWVNHPGNFVALTIQNRDQSFAIHVKGEPKQFNAPSLDLKPDRSSYSRFKLQLPSQMDDAIRVILTSAKTSEGY